MPETSVKRAYQEVLPTRSVLPLTASKSLAARHDHNLRITRIIRSLLVLLGEETAKQVLAMIEERVEAARNPANR